MTWIFITFPKTRISSSLSEQTSDEYFPTKHHELKHTTIKNSFSDSSLTQRKNALRGEEKKIFSIVGCYSDTSSHSNPCNQTQIISGFQLETLETKQYQLGHTGWASPSDNTGKKPFQPPVAPVSNQA